MIKNKIIYFNLKKVEKDILKIIKSSKKDIKRIFNYIYNDNNYKTPFFVGIHFVNNDKIQELNMEYRNIDKPTDVLSFPDDLMDGKRIYIGDIFINKDIIIKQALEIESLPEIEIKFLIMHGLLHLVGYDHIEKNDEIKMLNKQKEIFRKLEIRND